MADKESPSMPPLTAAHAGGTDAAQEHEEANWLDDGERQNTEVFHMPDAVPHRIDTAPPTDDQLVAAPAAALTPELRDLADRLIAHREAERQQQATLEDEQAKWARISKEWLDWAQSKQGAAWQDTASTTTKTVLLFLEAAVLSFAVYRALGALPFAGAGYVGDIGRGGGMLDFAYLFSAFTASPQLAAMVIAFTCVEPFLVPLGRILYNVPTAPSPPRSVMDRHVWPLLQAPVVLYNFNVRSFFVIPLALHHSLILLGPVVNFFDYAAQFLLLLVAIFVLWIAFSGSLMQKAKWVGLCLLGSIVTYFCFGIVRAAIAFLVLLFAVIIVGLCSLAVHFGIGAAWSAIFPDIAMPPVGSFVRDVTSPLFALATFYTIHFITGEAWFETVYCFLLRVATFAFVLPVPSEVTVFSPLPHVTDASAQMLYALMASEWALLPFFGLVFGFGMLIPDTFKRIGLMNDDVYNQNSHPFARAKNLSNCLGTVRTIAVVGMLCTTAMLHGFMPMLVLIVLANWMKHPVAHLAALIPTHRERAEPAPLEEAQAEVLEPAVNDLPPAAPAEAAPQEDAAAVGGDAA